jgi:uncharacterized protein (DUF885 family)
LKQLAGSDPATTLDPRSHRAKLASLVIQEAAMLHLSRRTALMSAASLASLSACAPREEPASTADADFLALGAKWLDDTARMRPVSATGRGDHRFDAVIDDMSADGRAARAAVRNDAATALAAIDRTALSRDNQVDAVMLADRLEGEAFADETLQTWAWDPLVYSDLAGGSLYSLMAREFAPLPERLASAASRMEALPDLLAQARLALAPERVPQVFAETYSAQNSGAADIIDNLILIHFETLGPSDRTRLNTAAAIAKAALSDHQGWIDAQLVPNARGDFRLGARNYARKLRYSIDSPAPPEDILTRARADLERVTGEMTDIARSVLAAQPGASPLPETLTADQRRETIAAALELAYADRSEREALFDDVRATLDDATNFAREKNLLTLPDAPVKVIEMPKFQQGVAVAYCDSPGPLDRQLDTFYAVSPIPASWTTEQTDSFLREYNTRSLYELTVHEAMPGHYVQLWHANKHPGLLRAVLGSGPFIEGWACYAQDMMIEAGHGGDDPLRRLINLKWALRVISNAILDQGVHVEGWGQEEAMRFMTQDAFQEEREAAGKWTRARLSSGQLATYYAGWSDHWALRREAETRQGAEFALRRYHDELLSHGSPPVRLARALMFGDAIA